MAFTADCSKHHLVLSTLIFTVILWIREYKGSQCLQCHTGRLWKKEWEWIKPQITTLHPHVHRALSSSSQPPHSSPTTYHTFLGQLPVQRAMTALRERSYFRNKPLGRGHWGFLPSYLHQAQREDPAFLLLIAWNSCSWKRGVFSLLLLLPLDIPAAASRLWWGAETCREEWWGCQKSKSYTRIFLSPLVFECAHREVQRGVATAVTYKLKLNGLGLHCSTCWWNPLKITCCKVFTDKIETTSFVCFQWTLSRGGLTYPSNI